MNLSNIRTQLENISYEWKKPQTYLVLVPGLSLIIQKIQLSSTLPLINKFTQQKANDTLPLIHKVTQQNADEENSNSRKFANICKWHLRGSMIQIVVSIIAIKVLASPIFALITLLAAYEMADTLIKSLKHHVTYYKFYPNGNLQVTTESACNIF